MNPNQYCGPAANFMPMSNAAPYYQQPIMSPRINEPPPIQMNQFSQPVMNSPNSMPQYSSHQNHYGNSPNVNYSVPSPVVHNPTPFQSIQQNVIPNQAANSIQSPRLSNYQYGQPSQVPVYPSQSVPGQNYHNNPNSYQYGDTVNLQSVCNTAQPLQNHYTTNANNSGNMYSPPVDPQQMTYASRTNLPTPNVTATKEPTHEDVPKFKPTNVIGEYKCSDFPNLYTGPFRYSGYPTQRKPFTLKHDSARHDSERRTHIGLARHAKRWELRGGKYYGCFTSRTNGLQDVCPKAKCKLCPTERKK